MTDMESRETKSIITGLLISNPLRCTVKQLCDDFRNTVGYNIPVHKLGFPSVENYLRSIPDTVRILGTGLNAEVRCVVKEKSAHMNELVVKQKKDNIPAHKRKNIRVYQDISRPSSSQSPSSSSGKHLRTNKPTDNFECEHRSRVPKRIQNNLRKLLMQFPNGIWCTDLRNLYRKMFKEDLNYEKYHFRSLIQLCSDLPEIFHYVQPTSDDFMLYDRSKAIPSFSQNESNVNSQKDTGLTVTLCKIQWSLGSSLVPSNIVHLSDEIPQFYLTDIKVGDYLDINIGEIYGLNNFWIFLKYGKLSVVMKELQNFFNSERNRFEAKEIFLIEGLYCTVLYEKMYHRCVIIDSLPQLPGFVQVLFIDYGSVGRVCSKDVWYLPKQFGLIPSQAIKAQLSHVKTTGDPDKAVEKFTSFTTNTQLVAHVININQKEGVLDVYLAEISDTNNIFYVNDILVEKGYATYSLPSEKN